MNKIRTMNGTAAAELSNVLAFKPAGVVQPPAPEEIAHAAYLAWEHDGMPVGRDADYWFAAESQLRAGGARKNCRARAA